MQSDAKDYVTGEVWAMPIETAPLGKKLIAINEGGVAVFAVLTSGNRDMFTHWYPLPRVPKDAKLRLAGEQR